MATCKYYKLQLVTEVFCYRAVGNYKRCFESMGIFYGWPNIR